MGGETPVQQLQHRSLVHHLSVLRIRCFPQLFRQLPLIASTELLNNGQRF